MRMCTPFLERGVSGGAGPRDFCPGLGLSDNDTATLNSALSLRRETGINTVSLTPSFPARGVASRGPESHSTERKKGQAKRALGLSLVRSLKSMLR